MASLAGPISDLVVNPVALYRCRMKLTIIFSSELKAYIRGFIKVWIRRAFEFGTRPKFM